MTEKGKTEHKGTAAGHKGSMTTSEAGHQRHLREPKEVHGETCDKPGPPKGTAFGIAAITQALEGVDFPTTKHELLKRAGHHQIEYRKGQPLSLHQVIEDLKEEEYPSMANVVEAVSEALKEEGLSSGEGAKRKRAA